MNTLKPSILLLFGLFTIGCFLNRSGTLLTNQCEGVEVNIGPIFSCQDETITVSWNITPLNTKSCPTCRSGIGDISLDITSTLPGASTISSNAASGSQIISVPAGFSRGFTIIVTVNRSGWSEEAQENRTHQCIKSQEIWVLPEDNTRVFQDSLVWCCTCLDGASGYPSFTYDIGEITSPNAEVTSLRNTNAFSILLRVEGRTNEMGLPDDVPQILLPPGARVSDFNGQLNGNWIGITDPPPPIIDCGGNPGDPVVDPDPNAPVIIISPTIHLEWSLTCNRE